MGSCCSNGKTRLNRGPALATRNCNNNAMVATNSNNKNNDATAAKCANYDRTLQRVSFGKLPEINSESQRTNAQQTANPNICNENNETAALINNIPSPVMPPLEQYPSPNSQTNVLKMNNVQSNLINTQLQEEVEHQRRNNLTNNITNSNNNFINGITRNDDLLSENAVVREVDSNDTHLRHERLFSVENARDHGIVPGVDKYANMQSFHKHSSNDDDLELESIASTSEIEMQNAGFDHNDNNNNNGNSKEGEVDEDTGSENMPSALSATTTPASSITNSATNAYLQSQSNQATPHINNNKLRATRNNKDNHIFFNKSDNGYNNKYNVNDDDYDDDDEEELEESSVYAASSMAFGTPVEVASFASDFSSIRTSAASSLSSSVSSLALMRSGSRYSNASRKRREPRNTLVPSSQHANVSLQVTTPPVQTTPKEHMTRHQDELPNEKTYSDVDVAAAHVERGAHTALSKPPLQRLTPLPSVTRTQFTNANSNSNNNNNNNMNTNNTNTTNNNTNTSTINVTVVRSNSTKPFKTSRPTTPLPSHSNVPYGSFDDQHRSLYTPLPSSAYANSEAGFVSCHSISSFANEEENELITPRLWPTLTKAVLQEEQEQTKQQQEQQEHFMLKTELTEHAKPNIRTEAHVTNPGTPFSREPFRRLRSATSITSQAYSSAAPRELPPLPLAPISPPLTTTTTTTNNNTATSTALKRQNSNTAYKTPTRVTNAANKSNHSINHNNNSNKNVNTHEQVQHRMQEPTDRTRYSKMSTNNTLGTPASRLLHSAISAWDQQTNASAISESQFSRYASLHSARSVDSFSSSQLVPAPLARELHYEQEPQEQQEQQEQQRKQHEAANAETYINTTTNNNNHKAERLSENNILSNAATQENHTTQTNVERDNHANEVIVQMRTDSDEEESQNAPRLNSSAKEVTCEPPSLSPVTTLHTTPAKREESQQAQLLLNTDQTKHSQADFDNSIGADVVEVSELSESSPSHLTPKQLALSEMNDTISELIECDKPKSSNEKLNRHVSDNSYEEEEFNMDIEVKTPTVADDVATHSAIPHRHSLERETDKSPLSRTGLTRERDGQAKQSQNDAHAPYNINNNMNANSKHARNDVNCTRAASHEMSDSSSEEYDHDRRCSHPIHRQHQYHLQRKGNDGTGGSSKSRSSNEDRPPWLGGRHLTTSTHFINPDYASQHKHRNSITHVPSQRPSYPSITPIRVGQATSANLTSKVKTIRSANISLRHANRNTQGKRKSVASTPKVASASNTRTTRVNNVTNNHINTLEQPKWARSVKVSTSETKYNKTRANGVNKRSAEHNITENYKIKANAESIHNASTKQSITPFLPPATTEFRESNDINKVNNNKKVKHINAKRSKVNFDALYEDGKRNSVRDSGRLNELEFMLIESSIAKTPDQKSHINTSAEDAEKNVARKTAFASQPNVTQADAAYSTPITTTSPAITINNKSINKNTTGKNAISLANASDASKLVATSCVKTTTYTMQAPSEQNVHSADVEHIALVEKQNELIHQNLIRNNMQHAYIPAKNRKGNSNNNSSSEDSEKSNDNSESYNKINNIHYTHLGKAMQHEYYPIV